MKAKNALRRALLAATVLLEASVAGCFGKAPGVAPIPGASAVEVAHQVIVGFRTPSEPHVLQAAGVGLTQVDAISLGKKVAVYEMPTGASSAAVLKALAQRPDVEWAEPNHVQSTSQWPNDPYFYRQWALASSELDPDPIWNRNLDASHVTVAVLDTGIDPYHPEFSGRVLMGLNAITGNTDSEDDEGHGTHVAGILAAAGNNGIGIAGVCWQCKLLAVKVLDRNGGNDAYALKGIAYAVDNGANVINMSFNSEDTRVSSAYEWAVNYALSKNVVVVAAAGNDGGAVTQPATTPGLIAVAATGLNDELSPYTNRGSAVGVAAPGDSIFSTYLNDGYKVDTGTSMAAPFVSGAAALLRAEHPDWSARQIVSAIESATDPLVSVTDPTLRIGRLDFSKLP